MVGSFNFFAAFIACLLKESQPEDKTISTFVTFPDLAKVTLNPTIADSGQSSFLLGFLLFFVFSCFFCPYHLYLNCH
jgi:hypothetical protein